MRIVSIANQKGGCGKTTVAVNLASALQRFGARVLLIDNDPQGHASMALGIGSGEFSLSTRDLYLTSDVRLEDARIEIRSGLDLVPADVDLATVEQELQEGRRIRRLAEQIAMSETRYDLVLIDNPPNVGLLTFNSLMASTEAIVPIDAGRFTVDAVGRFRETLELLAEERGHRVKMHILPSGFDVRTRHAREILEEIDRLFPGDRLEVMIHQTVRIREAAAAGKPVDVYDGASRGAHDFAQLSQEMISYPVELGLELAPEIRVETSHGPRPRDAGMEFVAKFPGARSVAITGDFTEWSVDGEAMQPAADGSWHLEMPMDPGCYEYKYIVDGVWRVDPENPERTRNSYGQLNSVVVVPSSKES